MAVEEGPKPRINGSMLPKHTGQIVSVVAKYLGVGYCSLQVYNEYACFVCMALKLKPLRINPPKLFVLNLQQEGSNTLKLETSDGQALRAKLHQPLVSAWAAVTACLCAFANR